MPEDAEGYPGADDWYGDGVDQNCDGVDGLDRDGDGFATDEFGGPDCDDSNAHIAPVDRDGDGLQGCAGDCDDGDPQRSPELPEICDGRDNDCDGALPEGEQDLDGDGYLGCAGDCGPLDAAVHPDAEELCDEQDADCDGSLDDEEPDTDSDGLPDCVDSDDDDDGFPDGGDCEPLNGTIHPGAVEVCNGLDDDCSGAPASNEIDDDEDGYPPCAGDCNDADPAVFQGSPESCNGLDDDCDGYVPSVEEDLDGDGFTTCGGDCNDAIATMFPNAPEACNRWDDSCDGVLPADELDMDGDGLTPCEGDCLDTDAAVFPGNGLWEDPNDGSDSNCDGIDATSADTAWAWVEGASAFDNLGAAACAVPDLDLDGVPELVVGAPLVNSNGTNAGRLYVFSGADLQAGLNPTTSALATVSGAAAFDQLGWSATGGDFNGDGRSELVTGAYLNSDLAQYAGEAYVFDGATVAGGGSFFAGDAELSVGGESSWDYVGWSMAATGDVDGDGRPDLMLAGYGANGATDDVGRTAIFHSSALPSSGSLLLSAGQVQIDGLQAFETSGWGLASGGDIDGDGLDEVLIGAPFADSLAIDGGRAYVFRGAQLQTPATLSAASAHATFTGDGLESHLGWFVQFVGDLDGDSLPEVAVGWPLRDGAGQNRGALALWWGSTLAAGGTLDPANADLLVEGVEDFGNLGYSAVSAGDVDGDGLDDLLVAAPGSSTSGDSGGNVHLFLGANLPVSGPVSADDADVTFAGDQVGAGLGRYLCRGADFNGDGRDDLILPAQWHPGTSTLAGRAYVFLSPL